MVISIKIIQLELETGEKEMKKKKKEGERKEKRYLSDIIGNSRNIMQIKLPVFSLSLKMTGSMARCRQEF